jgi:hypothetical protein
MIKAKLVKIESTHNNLRTNEIVGEFSYSPEVGHVFRFYSKPLDPDASIRVITTSSVQSINGQEFKTRNSTYRLEVDEIKE